MKEVPKFVLKEGQVDYTHVRWAPVINCVVKYGDKILVVQRNERLKFYPGFWTGVSGFLDDAHSLKEKVEEELKEELGLSESTIRSIRLGEIFHQDEPEYRKTWIVHPVLVEVGADKLKLDWEAEDFAWVTFDEARNLKLLPGFDRVLDNVGKLVAE